VTSDTNIKFDTGALFEFLSRHNKEDSDFHNFTGFPLSWSTLHAK
jgi:hypothetical protein